MSSVGVKLNFADQNWEEGSIGCKIKVIAKSVATAESRKATVF